MQSDTWLWEVFAILPAYQNYCQIGLQQENRKKQNAPFALSHDPTINMFCKGINHISHVATDLLTYQGLYEKYTVDFYLK